GYERGGIDVPDTPSERFHGRTAVVTGAASGIGAATARRLAAEGARVVLADIDPAGAATAEKINAPHPDQAEFVRMDVADEAGWASLADRFEGDALVRNAAIAAVRPVLEHGREPWDRHLAVGLSGTFLGARALLPGLRDRGGNIVATSSV